MKSTQQSTPIIGRISIKIGAKFFIVTLYDRNGAPISKDITWSDLSNIETLVKLISTCQGKIFKESVTKEGDPIRVWYEVL